MATDYLYLNPTFFRGAARVADFWGSLDENNTSKTTDEADRLALESDARALANDWEKVGLDLEAGIASAVRQLKTLSASRIETMAALAELAMATKPATTAVAVPEAAEIDMKNSEESFEDLEEVVKAILAEMAKLDRRRNEERDRKSR